MKLRSTTPVSTNFATKACLVAASVMMLIGTPVMLTQAVGAVDYDAQIKSLQREIDEYNKKASTLKDQRQTLESELSKLNNEKARIQSQINLSAAKAKKLASDIKANEEKIQENRVVLGDTVAGMAVDSTVSPVEMLASSKNIGEYLDKQTYQASVRDTLSSTIDDIKSLKKKLESQKKDVERVLADQNNAKRELAAKEAEKSELIAKTRGRENAYEKLSSKRESQKLEAERQNQAAIAAALSANGGGSFGSAGSLPSYASWVGSCYVDGNAMSYSLDPLGYGCNQCVSYTAYMMKQKTGYGPSYWGNANMWPNSARAAGFKVSTQPRANSIGVIMAGQYGHVVYVHNYNASAGTVDISQYNEYIPGQGWGKYSTRSGTGAGTYQYYIYL